MKATEVIAIFDVGKTNKKFFLFDEHYTIVFEKAVRLIDTFDDDGEPCEDIKELEYFIVESLKEATRRNEFRIRAINFSGYGATLVYLDEKGETVGPIYNYLKSFPADLLKQFYNKYGEQETIALQTASPLLNSLNSGLQFYRVKHEKPVLFEKIKFALHLPQFLSSIITRNYFADITSIGCHTMLWDFGRNDYHKWVYHEKLHLKLPTIVDSGKQIPVCFNDHHFVSGIGLHDSSAALVPYLQNYKEPFILLSTGTWNISFNPFNKTPLTASELHNDCLFYITYQGMPVKASRLFSGYAHEEEVARIAQHFSVQTSQILSIAFDMAIFAQVKKTEQEVLGKPGSMECFFSERDLSKFKTVAEAYHQLVFDLVRQQVFSTSLVLEGGEVVKIFVNGGLSKNVIYMNMLAAAFPGIEVFASSIPESSALGAALVLHSAWNNNTISEQLIELEKYPFFEQPLESAS